MFRFLILYLLIIITFLFFNTNIQACNKSNNNQGRIFSRFREQILPNRHTSYNTHRSINYSYYKSYQNQQISTYKLKPELYQVPK